MTRPQDSPPVHSDEQLRQRWRSIMGPDGFGGHALWLAWFDDAGYQWPTLMPVDDVDECIVDERELDELLTGLARIAAAPPVMLAGGSVALAYARPGGGEMTQNDRHLLCSAWRRFRAAGLRVRIPHLATRGSVQPLTIDDLV